MKTVIATTAAPAAIGPYCQAVKVGNMLFTSGQIPIDPATSQFVEGGIKEQTAQVFANLKAVLAEAGYTLEDVVKTTVFLADMSLFVPMNEVYAAQFTGTFPARSAVAVRGTAQRSFGRDRGDCRKIKTISLVEESDGRSPTAVAFCFSDNPLCDRKFRNRITVLLMI